MSVNLTGAMLCAQVFGSPMDRLRQLAEHTQEPLASLEFAHRFSKSRQIVGLCLVTDRARHLHEKLQPCRRLFRQPGQHGTCWRSIKGEIQLDERELRRIIAQPARRTGPGRVERTYPIGIGIARSADPNLHVPRSRRKPADRHVLRKALLLPCRSPLFILRGDAPCRLLLFFHMSGRPEHHSPGDLRGRPTVDRWQRLTERKPKIDAHSALEQVCRGQGDLTVG